MDEKPYDEHSEGELDLHDIMSDEEGDVFSHDTGRQNDQISLASVHNATDPDAYTRSMLANLPEEDLQFPKYVKATRKNNKSPRVFNNLFLAQELCCAQCVAPNVDPESALYNTTYDSIEKEGKARSGGNSDTGKDDDSQSDAKDNNNDANNNDVNTDDNSNTDKADAASCNSTHWDASKVPMNPHEILVMEFSRDGKYLAAAGRDSRITVWQVISSPLSRLKFKNYEAAAEAEGVSSKKVKSKMYNGAPVFLQEPVRVFEGHSKSVLCLDWSKNNFLLSGSMDKTVKLWNIERPECLDTFHHRDFVTALRFHPNDDRFFISGALDNHLRLWSVLERSVAYTNDLGDNALITALEFTPFGNYIMVGGFNGSLFGLETQGLDLVKRIELRKKRKTPLSHSADGITISGIRIFENPSCADLPSSALEKWNVLITTNDSTIRLVDLSSKKLVTRFRGNSNQSSSIVASLSEDSRYIISGSEDHHCYVWDNNNSIINNKLRSSVKGVFLEHKNHLDEKHKRISKVLHDNKLWKKLPIQMFLEDENGKKYVANENNSYASFQAHNSQVNVALFAPEKTKRLLKFSDDKIFDLVKRGTLSAESRGTEISSETTWGSDHIIVTSDLTGLIRVYRQDPAFYIRKNLLELKKMQKRDRSRTSHEPATPTSELSHYGLEFSPKSDRITRNRSLSPTQEGPSCLRSKISQKIRTPATRNNSTSSRYDLRTRSNSDMSRRGQTYLVP
ncbi:hypothetical protein JCM33374_g2204 [Metschnikowia sp. JCM 33374]|nr:hypothetical protein JCM33374_g2204 [Metschnikowia sp. JCM 33374]